MIFLFKVVIFRFQPLILQGVAILAGLGKGDSFLNISIFSMVVFGSPKRW